MDLDSINEDVLKNIKPELEFLSVNYVESLFNENLKDDTNKNTIFCYEVFRIFMDKDLLHYKLNKDYQKLTVFAEHVKKINSFGHFDSKLFLKLLTQEFDNMPLEIVWWLNKYNIVSFLSYCEMVKPPDIAGSIKEFMTNDKISGLLDSDVVIKDLLTEILRGSYRPSLGIYGVDTSKTWSIYCSQILENVVQEHLAAILSGNSSLLICSLPFIRQSSEHIPELMIKRFYKNILNVIITCNIDKIDIFEAYTYQQLWKSDKLNETLELIYDEIFKYFGSAKDIINIIEEHEPNINWKFALSAIAACVKRSKTGAQDILAAACGILSNSFIGGRVKQFIQGLLLIRQVCFESNADLTYRAWYSRQFGLNSTFQTTCNVTYFKFLISCLTLLIPYEPKEPLNVHIQQSLLAPRTYNYLIHDYKNLARAREKELTHSPSVSLNGLKIKVLHLIEESSRNQIISPILMYIIQHQYVDYVSIIIPQLVKSSMPFVKVRDILKKQGYLNDTLTDNVTADYDDALFDTEEDDFQ